MSNFDLRKFLAEGKLHEEAASTEEVMDKPSTKMKMSELKKKIREEILSELTLNEDDEISVGGAETQADVDFYEGLEEATKDGDGEVPSKDADTDIDIEDKEEVEVDVEKKPKVTGIDGEFLDQLEDLKDEADAMGDNKLERQIDNTITYFTRQHIAKDTNESIELEEADDMALVADLEAELAEGYSEFQRVDKGKKKTAAKDKAEGEVYGAGVEKGEEIEKAKVDKTQESLNKSLKTKMTMRNESLNEDVNITNAIITFLAFLIGIPVLPIAGGLLLGLINYIFNELPDQYYEFERLRKYKGPDKQEEVLALAKEIESKLSPGKKRYLKTLVDRIGKAKLADKASAYLELDQYASSQKNQMDNMNENLNADIEAALKDLPVPTDMGKDKESLNESVVFPLWNKIK